MAPRCHHAGPDMGGLSWLAVKMLIAAVTALALAAIIVLVLAGDSTAGKGVALALFGVACVVAVSAVFWVVGRSEDAERAAAAAPEAPEPADGEDPHPRPALDRRRPMPPRRPS